MRLNIMALGDVGQNALLGLKLLSGGLVDEIGIYDINENLVKRLEIEMGQIAYASSGDADCADCDDLGDADCADCDGETRTMPTVIAIGEDELLDCDVILFCATRGVPPIGEGGDVRMAQLEANGELVRELGNRIKGENKNGESVPELVLIMSDPVDQLCNIMLESSELQPERIRGLGLGVMNARARYFAERDSRFESYLRGGRVFGPHGKNLIVANGIENYDDEISRDLTELVVNANMRVRELGYKPYIAPAISSGALSIIEMLKGNWTYGSVYLENPFGAEGSSYFGMMSRLTENGWEVEELNLPYELLLRLKESFEEELRR
ncbi:MAG: lactate dehydrogenase [Firmicutes bacterium]|nr:lactate dehydrogenase [Bacillota bacterium]